MKVVSFSALRTGNLYRPAPLLWKWDIILEFESLGTIGNYSRMHKSESYLCLLPKRKKREFCGQFLHSFLIIRYCRFVTPTCSPMAHIWYVNDWHRASNHPTLCLFNCAVNNQDSIMQNDRTYSTGSFWYKRGCGDTQINIPSFIRCE